MPSIKRRKGQAARTGLRALADQGATLTSQSPRISSGLKAGTGARRSAQEEGKVEKATSASLRFGRELEDRALRRARLGLDLRKQESGEGFEERRVTESETAGAAGRDVAKRRITETETAGIASRGIAGRVTTEGEKAGKSRRDIAGRQQEEIEKGGKHQRDIAGRRQAESEISGESRRDIAGRPRGGSRRKELRQLEILKAPGERGRDGQAKRLRKYASASRSSLPVRKVPHRSRRLSTPLTPRLRSSKTTGHNITQSS